MSVTVLALVVAAAFAHAAGTSSPSRRQAVPLSSGCAPSPERCCTCPLLVVALVADPGPLGWTAIAFMAVSGALHALYFVLLQRAYATGDLSVVYPLARGTGPLLSTTAAIVIFAERPSLLALAGAALIVAAVFSLMGPRVDDPGRGDGARGAHRRGDRRVHALGQARGRPTGAVADRLLLGHEPRQRRPAHAGGPARARRAAPGVDALADAGRGRRAAEPARVRPRALRAGARPGQLRRTRPREQHRRRHPAGCPGAPREGLGTTTRRRGGHPPRGRRARRSANGARAAARARRPPAPGAAACPG